MTAAARLRRDARGVTAIEFAIVAPVLLLVMLGFGELSYRAYAQEVLTGVVQKAGRDSTIQGAGAQSNQIDTVVINQLSQLRAGWTQSCATTPSTSTPTYCSSRKSYASFGSVAPEPFVDGNNNGIHDAKECFTDINGNGTYDTDPGEDGQGGANDVVVYTMTISYPRIFPLATFLGWTATQTLQATTVLKNQPYANQNVATATQVCP